VYPRLDVLHPISVTRLSANESSFLPGYFLLLGWPLFPPLLFNGHMYGLGREPWTKVEVERKAEGGAGRFSRGESVRGY